jgi:hypothetical protein
MLDRGACRERAPLEQQLPGEQRAVERSRAEDDRTVSAPQVSSYQVSTPPMSTYSPIRPAEAYCTRKGAV